LIDIATFNIAINKPVTRAVFLENRGKVMPEIISVSDISGKKLIAEAAEGHREKKDGRCSTFIVGLV